MPGPPRGRPNDRAKGVKPPRAGIGRAKGAKDKVPRAPGLKVEVAELAREHGEAAIRKLRRIMDKAGNDSAAVAAARELLDRGYGRVPTPITGQNNEPIAVTVKWLDDDGAKPPPAKPAPPTADP
jgi:hypothetical protein